MKMNLEGYGNYDITGYDKNKEYDAVPNLYDERRKTYFNDIADKLSSRII
jgi:hypothetical protein